MRNYIFQSIFVVVIVFVACVCVKCANDNTKEIKRLRTNQTELTTEKACDTVNHITEATTLTATSKKELKQLTTTQEKNAIKKVGTKPGRVNSITTLHTTTRVDTVVRIDTIVRNDTVVPVFHYRDSWCDFAGELDNGEVHFDIKMCDSVNIIAHRVPRKFLFIKFGTKAVKVDVYNSNPYNTIRSAKEVKLIK